MWDKYSPLPQTVLKRVGWYNKEPSVLIWWQPWIWVSDPIAYHWAGVFLSRQFGVYWCLRVCSSWGLKLKRMGKGWHYWDLRYKVWPSQKWNKIFPKSSEYLVQRIFSFHLLLSRFISAHFCTNTQDFPPLSPWQQTWSSQLVFGQGLDCAAELVPPESSDWGSWKSTLRGV